MWDKNATDPRIWYIFLLRNGRLWFENWNSRFCQKWKYVSGRPSRSTVVDQGKLQTLCSLSCICFKVQQNESGPDNVKSLGYERQYIIDLPVRKIEPVCCVFYAETKTVRIPLRVSIEIYWTKKERYHFGDITFCHTCSLCRVELVVQFPARGSTQVLLCFFPGVLWLWHFLYSVGPHPVSSLHIYTFVVSRAFMAGPASQAGDADSSWAPGLTSGLQRSVNVHRGALLVGATVTVQ